MKKRMKSTTIRVISLILLIALCFPLFGCEKKDEVSDVQTVSEDIVYYDAQELEAIYEPKEDESFEIIQTVGDESGIAVLLHIYKYPEDGEIIDETEMYDYYQIALLDMDGNVSKTISLKDIVDQSAWLQVFVKRDDGGYSVILPAVYDENGQSDGNIGILNLDSEGNQTDEILEIALGQGKEVNQILFGDDGNMYMKGYEASSTSYSEFVAALDPAGKELFSIQLDSVGGSPMSFGQALFIDGTDVYVDVLEYSDTGTKYSFCKLELNQGKFGDSFEIAGLNSAMAGGEIYSGNGKIFTSNDFGVYEIDMQEKSAAPLLLWKDLDINRSADEVKTILLDEEMFFLTKKTWINGGVDGTENKYYLLKKAEKNPNVGKEIILLGGFGLSWERSIQDAVYLFNKKSTTHRVEIYDYEEKSESGDYIQAINSMNMDILSGNTPDIIVGSSFNSMDTYIVKDVLADLNPMLENDPEFKKEDYFENILALQEKEGKLYTLNTNFTMMGLVGATSLIGDRIGWSIDEFEEVVSTFPENMKPMQGVSYDTLLQMSYIAAGEQFVDWENKEVRFDSEAFIELLNYAKTYGVLVDQQNMGDMVTEVSINEAIQNKELAFVDGFGFREILVFSSLWGVFGEPITMVGFPSAGKNGPACYSDLSFSISEKSANKEEAWDMIKMLLSEEIQDQVESNYSGFPVLRSSMDKIIENEKKDKSNYGTMSIMNEDGSTLTFENAPLSDEAATAFLKIVESLHTGVSFDMEITNIITEEADAFFKGGKTDQDTVKIIQNRVQTLVNERA